MYLDSDAGQATGSKSESRRAYAGVVLEHGKAKFNFDPKEKFSYFIRLATPAGETVVWGKDLERAIRGSDCTVGDAIKLEYKGSQPVSVDAIVRDDQGQPIGKERIQTIRNTWHAKKIDAAELAQQGTSQIPSVGGSTAPVHLYRGGYTHSPNTVRVGQPGFGQSLMLGAKGLAALGGLIGRGGEALQHGVATHSVRHIELELHRELNIASGQLQRLTASVQSDAGDTLKASTADLHVTQPPLRVNAGDPQDQLQRQIERIQALSTDFVKRALKAGIEPDEARERGVTPIKQFIAANETALKGMSRGGETLHQSMERAVAAILQVLAELIDRLTQGSSPGKGCPVPHN